MPLKGDAEGEIQGDNKHGTTCVRSSDRTLNPEAPDADCLRPVALTVGTVARDEHRTLAVSGQGGPDASGRKIMPRGAYWK